MVLKLSPVGTSVARIFNGGGGGGGAKQHSFADMHTMLSIKNMT